MNIHFAATFKQHVAAMALVPVNNALALPEHDGDCSSTDLARAWESVSELRRRATRQQLVSRMLKPTFFCWSHKKGIWYAFGLNCSSSEVLLPWSRFNSRILKRSLDLHWLTTSTWWHWPWPIWVPEWVSKPWMFTSNPCMILCRSMFLVTWPYWSKL